MVDACFRLTDWGQEWGGDPGGGTGMCEQHGQRGRYPALAVGGPDADGGQLGDSPVGWRAESAAHAEACGGVDGDSDEAAAVDGRPEAGDIMVGGGGLAVGVALGFGDLSEFVVGRG